MGVTCLCKFMERYSSGDSWYGPDFVALSMTLSTLSYREARGLRVPYCAAYVMTVVY